MKPVKRWSIVGNARSLFEQKHGATIDRADEVVRFNGGIVVKPEYQGMKTTILAYSLYRNNLHSFGSVRFLDTKTLRRERALLEAEVGHKPSNGLVVLEWLRGESDVHIFGFDWKATPTWYRHKPGAVEHHDYAAEKAYCMDLIRQQGWALYM